MYKRYTLNFFFRPQSQEMEDVRTLNQKLKKIHPMMKCMMKSMRMRRTLMRLKNVLHGLTRMSKTVIRIIYSIFNCKLTL